MTAKSLNIFSFIYFFSSWLKYLIAKNCSSYYVCVCVVLLLLLNITSSTTAAVPFSFYLFLFKLLTVFYFFYTATTIPCCFCPSFFLISVCCFLFCLLFFNYNFPLFFVTCFYYSWRVSAPSLFFFFLSEGFFLC